MRYLCSASNMRDIDDNKPETISFFFFCNIILLYLSISKVLVCANKSDTMLFLFFGFKLIDYTVLCETDVCLHIAIIIVVMLRLHFMLSKEKRLLL